MCFFGCVLGVFFCKLGVFFLFFGRWSPMFLMGGGFPFEYIWFPIMSSLCARCSCLALFCREVISRNICCFASFVLFFLFFLLAFLARPR